MSTKDRDLDGSQEKHPGHPLDREAIRTLLDAEKVTFSAIRATGPGGQHVNTSSTAVQLRFDITTSKLPENLKQRLLARHDQRLTSGGVIVIKAQDHRSQYRNRQAAMERLVEMIAAVANPPKPRRPTRVSRAARRKRLDSKRRRGQTKSLRKPVSGE